MKELKAFDLERAKSGDKILLDGKDDVAFIGVSLCGYPVVQHNVCGPIYAADENRLSMAPKKRTVWVNFYACVGENAIGNGKHSYWFDDEQTAHDSASDDALFVAVPVEIEE